MRTRKVETRLERSERHKLGAQRKSDAAAEAEAAADEMIIQNVRLYGP